MAVKADSALTEKAGNNIIDCLCRTRKVLPLRELVARVGSEGGGAKVLSSDSPALILADPFDFARRGGELVGEVAVSVFGRLGARSGNEPLRYRVSGWQAGDPVIGMRHFLLIEVEATVVLECQRCLEDVPYAVAVQARLMLVPESEALPEDDLAGDLGEEDFDPVHAGHNLDVMALIEDELLLALPFAPVHDECSVPGDAGLDKEASPFAVLGRLKRGN